MKWNEKNTCEFVKEYIKYECLYNSKDLHYKNKRVKDAAVLNICEALKIEGFGPKEALLKIKSIRSTYSQELKKINQTNKSGAGSDDVYVPTLKWFPLYDNAIKDKNLTPKETHSNLTVNVETVIEENVADEFSTQEAPISSEAVHITEETKTPAYSRKRNIKSLENLVNKVKAVGELIQTPQTNTLTEFDIFGKGVAAQLNVMPLKTALQAQWHVQNYLTTVRLETMANPENLLSTTTSPSPMSANTLPTTMTNNDLSSGIFLDRYESNNKFVHDSLMDVTVETIHNEHSYV